MTTERSGPRPAEADIARNVADLLNRAHGQDLTPDEAKAVAVDANRPVRPQAEAPDDPATAPEPDDEPDEQAETSLACGPRRCMTCSTPEMCRGGCEDRELHVQRGDHAGQLARVRGARSRAGDPAHRGRAGPPHPVGAARLRRRAQRLPRGAARAEDPDPRPHGDQGPALHAAQPRAAARHLLRDDPQRRARSREDHRYPGARPHRREGLPGTESADDRRGASRVHHHADRPASQGPARRAAVLPRRAARRSRHRDGTHPPGVPADDRPEGPASSSSTRSTRSTGPAPATTSSPTS